MTLPLELADTTPPILSVTLSPATLWPPNGKPVPVTATVTVKDDYDPNPEIKLESITASEPLLAGDIADAQFGADDRRFALKARRTGGNKPGRVYTVTYSATDASGNKAITTAEVIVPHDQGKQTGIAYCVEHSRTSQIGKDGRVLLGSSEFIEMPISLRLPITLT